jgi:hypothetical protein
MSSARDIQLEQAAAGDGEAFRAVIAPHLGTLRVLCRRLAPTEADAQDLLRSSVRPLTGPSGEALCRPDQRKMSRRLRAWIETEVSQGLKWLRTACV